MNDKLTKWFCHLDLLFLMATVSHLIRDVLSGQMIFRFNDLWRRWIVMWEESFRDFLDYCLISLKDSLISSRKFLQRLSSLDNSSLSWTIEQEKDHSAWRIILDEMQYCSHQKQEVQMTRITLQICYLTIHGWVTTFIDFMIAFKFCMLHNCEHLLCVIIL